MPAYTSVERVVSILGWVDENGNRPTLSDDTIPTLDELTEFIEEAESEIESRAMTAWKSVTVTDEYHDTPHTYMKWHGMGMYYQLRNRHVKDFDTAEGDKIEIWQGESFYDIVANGTAGTGPLDGDYFLSGEDGLLYLHTNFPAFHQHKTVRFTYRYGQATVPPAIRRASALLAASYAIEAGFDWTYTMVDNEGSMSHSEKAERWESKAYAAAASYRVNAPVPQY